MARVMYVEEAGIIIARKDYFFPSSMVDRVTPKCVKGSRDEVDRVNEFGRDFNFRDETIPVVCEAFRQWIIEDHFSPMGKPPLHLLEGVKFVDNATMTKYEDVKVCLFIIFQSLKNCAS
jgi:mannitol 2-dehydrogenase